MSDVRPDPNRDRKRAATVAQPFPSSQGRPMSHGPEAEPLADGRGSAKTPLAHGRRSDWLGGPLAYFITFRTYATWLHGDARGSVDRNHNIPGTPFLPPDPQRRSREHGLTRSSAVMLDADRRKVVTSVIVEVCDHNEWTIQELNVRTNHVHLVVAAPERPEPVMRALKSWCTRRLREAGLITATEDVWSRHGSTQYLWKKCDVEAACTYVRDFQGDDL